MSDFEKILLRLKEQLGASDDKDVAELLGLTDKALSARKRRNAFPEDKLRALAQQRPELGIDVAYVLTGRWTERDFQERRQTLHRRLREARGEQDLGEFAASLGMAPEDWTAYETGARPATSGLIKLIIERRPEIDPMALLLDAPQRLEGEFSHLEVVLIQNYRASSPEGQEMLRRLAVHCAEYHRKGNQ
ncbi:helix-turn-helix domain-containing protein [Methylococcus sp. BF19-07]|nr:helix-turn-helix domain-containing protein [Methylococcus sp. BF19-07]